MLTISELFIYPIKSLGGISLPSALVTDTGFEYDRKWMLVDSNLRCLTQRGHPSMALLQVELTSTGLKVFHKNKTNCFITIPFIPSFSQPVVVQIFDETCEAALVSSEADKWFSDMLSIDCRLVYMPASMKRFVDNQYATNNEITGFSDSFPFLIIGQASLDDLNSKLAEALPINRFRPNIVFTGGTAYQEDFMEHFIINDINFYGVKLCARCVIPTINQVDASRSKEPLKTLATYRQRDNNIYFGQNLLAKGNGTVSVGDQLSIIKIQC
jgi:Uncharacterized Fe-S protein